MIWMQISAFANLQDVCKLLKSQQIKSKYTPIIFTYLILRKNQNP